MATYPTPASNFLGSLQSDDLAKLREIVEKFARPDQLRQLQAAGAPIASNFEQRGFQGNDDGASTRVTAAEVYRVSEAANKKFFQLVLTFDSGSGMGRYRIDGPDPTPTRGTAVPAGHSVLTITGSDNIKNFALIAEAGQSLTFTRNMFA